jgi:L-alanine-DL-glutamate epimerase-like enolase superfamily enzyme
LATPLKPINGVVTVPTTPGMGMEPDMDKAESWDEVEF